MSAAPTKLFGRVLMQDDDSSIQQMPCHIDMCTPLPSRADTATRIDSSNGRRRRLVLVFALLCMTRAFSHDHCCPREATFVAQSDSRRLAPPPLPHREHAHTRTATAHASTAAKLAAQPAASPPHNAPATVHRRNPRDAHVQIQYYT